VIESRNSAAGAQCLVSATLMTTSADICPRCVAFHNPAQGQNNHGAVCHNCHFVLSEKARLTRLLALQNVATGMVDRINSDEEGANAVGYEIITALRS